MRRWNPYWIALALAFLFATPTFAQYHFENVSLLPQVYPPQPTVGLAVNRPLCSFGSPGQISQYYATDTAALSFCTNTGWVAFAGSGGGSVTSVALTTPSWLTVTGSPITTSGTLAVTPTAAQTSHQVIGTCGAGTTFAPCALVAADIPTLNQNTTGTAANLSGTPALPNGTTATTQAALDNTTKIATDAFVTANGAGTGAGASPIMGFYLTSNCPATNTGSCFNTPANTQQDVTASWTTSSGTITITDGRFVAGDVGKRAYGYVTCNAFTGTLASNAASGAITTGTAVTITGFTDSNHVTISANPANAVSNTANVGGCFIWGTPDDTGAAALSTAVAAATSCPKVFLAAAYYMLTTPPGFMINNPTSCAQAASSYGGTFGNIYYAAGLEIEGRGRANTVLYLTPGFPESGACNHGPATNSCFVRQLEGRWADFAITGGDSSQGNSVVVLIDSIGPGSFDNFNCYNWGGGLISSYGLVFQQGWDQMRQVDISGCGGHGIYVGPAAFPIGYNVRSENSGNTALFVDSTGSFECHSCGFYTAQYNTTANPQIAVFNNGQTKCFDCDIQDGGFSSATGRTGVQNQSGAGIWYRQFGGDIHFASNTIYNAIAPLGGDTYLQSVDLSAGATGNTYKDVAGARFFDLGQVTGLASGGGTSVSGQWLGDASIIGTAQTAANITASTGWGTSGAAGNGISAVTGQTVNEQFTITAAGTPTANPTVAIVFPTPFQGVAPSLCFAIQTGGTGSIADLTISSAPTKTGVTFKWNATPVAASTYNISVQCSNR